MSEHEASLSLDEVRQSFIQAEASLKAIATSMNRLDATSAKLDAARQSLSDASGQMSSLAQRMGGLTQVLAEAATVIRESDPALLIQKLDSAEKRDSQLQDSIGQSATQLALIVRKLSESGQKVDLLVSRGEELSRLLNDQGSKLVLIQESHQGQAQRLKRLQNLVVFSIVIAVASVSVGIALVLR